MGFNSAFKGLNVLNNCDLHLAFWIVCVCLSRLLWPIFL